VRPAVEANVDAVSEPARGLEVAARVRLLAPVRDSQRAQLDKFGPIAKYRAGSG